MRNLKVYANKKVKLMQQKTLDEKPGSITVSKFCTTPYLNIQRLKISDKMATQITKCRKIFRDFEPLFAQAKASP